MGPLFADHRPPITAASPLPSGPWPLGDGAEGHTSEPPRAVAHPTQPASGVALQVHRHASEPSCPRLLDQQQRHHPRPLHRPDQS